MRFLFNLLNHNKLGQSSLEDPIGIVAHQLRALGHYAAWDPKNESLYPAGEGINIIVEGFTKDSVNFMKNAHEHGCRFIIIATEEPTNTGGFNHSTIDNDREMYQRQQMFPEAAKYASGIFYLVPGDHVGKWYNQFAPSAYVELGYARTMFRNPIPDSKRVHDFGFFGSLTRRRLTILKKIARAIGTEKAVLVESSFPTQKIRDDKMQTCKVILQIRKNEKMGLVSSSRCNTALNLGCAVFAEPHELSDPWDKIVRFSHHDPWNDTRNFCADAVLVRTAWKGIHAAQYDKFRTRLTPEFCIGRAFKEIGFDPDKSLSAVVAA